MLKNIFRVVIITICFYAQNTIAQLLPVDTAVKIGKLSNGLTYYIKPNSIPTNIVELRLVVKAGSLNEDEDQQGLAHMCEHMAFNGTKNFKKNELISFLQSIGVQFGNDLNAYTFFNETVYMLPIPTDKKENLEKGFQVLEDWAHNVTYLSDDIDNERNIILEESRSGKGADDRMNRLLYPIIFNGSKYAARLPIGLDSIIKYHKHETIRRFYSDWYRPNLMAVVVSGNITTEEAEAYIKKHFSTLTNPTVERKFNEITVPEYQQNIAKIVTDKEATMAIGGIYFSHLPHKEASTEQEYKTNLIKSIFTNAINNRLYDLSQTENPPFLGAGLFFSNFTYGYQSLQGKVYAGAKGINNSIENFVTEIEKIKRYGIISEELERVKKELMTSMENYVKEKDTRESSSVVDELIRNFLTNEPIPGIEYEKKLYEKILPTITLSDVNNFIKKIDPNGKFVATITAPDALASGLPSEAELISLIENTMANKKIVAYSENKITTPLFNKAVVSGKIIKKTVDKKLQTQTLLLNNGIKVTVKKTNYKNDEILLSAYRNGGTNQYDLKDKENASNLIGIIKAMGLSSFSNSDLNKVLTGKIANISPYISSITEGFSGNSSVADFETMLQMLHLYVTEPRLDEAAFNGFIEKNKVQAQYILANPEASFIDTLIKTMYNNSPYTPVYYPGPETYDKINLQRVFEMYKNTFSNLYGMHFVLVGSLPDEITEKLIEKYIGSLPTKKYAPKYAPERVEAILGQKSLQVKKGKEDKALALVMNHGKIPYSAELSLQGTALVDVLNIIITEELREKIQGIYSGGMSFNFSQLPKPKYSVFTFIPCGSQKVDTLLKALNMEIQKIKMFGPSAENLNKVKKQLITHAKTDMEKNSTWLSAIQNQYVYKSNTDRFLNYEKYINALTVAQIKKAANIFFNNKNIITAVLLPE